MLVLASDFDGTWKQNGIVSDEDIQAILQFQAAGNQFGIITGRSVGMIRGELEEFKVPFDFLICNNGAVIADQNYCMVQRIDPDFEDAKENTPTYIEEVMTALGDAADDRFKTE